MSRAMRFAPLLVLLAFVAFVAWRLTNPADNVVRSRLTGQPVPQFTLPPALPGRATLASADLASGTPRMVNIFASWCVPCIAEAPILGELERRGVAIDGIAIRDKPEDVAAFLAVGGCFVAAAGWLMRRQALVPVRDPRLHESLAFENL